MIEMSINLPSLVGHVAVVAILMTYGAMIWPA
jgi:hypothetical protein